MEYITIIGSRETPQNIVDATAILVESILDTGRTVRSGMATRGMDAACTTGYLNWIGRFSPEDVKTLGELYIGWEGMNGWKHGNLFGAIISPAEHFDNYKQAKAYASEMHPAWGACGWYARALHGRNPYQILGSDLETNSDLVIYYAPVVNGALSGGTATAANLSKRFSIPNYNLFVEEEFKDLLNVLIEMGIEIPTSFKELKYATTKSS